MKNMLSIAIIFAVGIVFTSKAEACIDSNCKPCPVGFSVAQKCCKEADHEDCVMLGKEVEDCGIGKWKEYAHSVPVKHKDYCCEDATESYCLTSGGRERYCGMGEEKEFPYSPVKKCCKDETEKDCAVIRAKAYCGKYQLEEYPVPKADCCNALLGKCTGKVKDCPRCI